MNKKDIYTYLESSKNIDIEVFITMAIVYLIKARGFKLKSIIKDIKKGYKNMERGKIK